MIQHEIDSIPRGKQASGWSVADEAALGALEGPTRALVVRALALRDEADMSQLAEAYAEGWDAAIQEAGMLSCYDNPYKR